MLLVAALVGMGCATTQELEEKTVEYAFSPDFNLKRIYVLAVVPSVGADTSDSLARQLLKEVSGKVYPILVGELMKVPAFDIVERRDIDEILEELEFSHSPYVMREKAPKLGRLLGADLVAYFTVLDVDRIVYPFGDSEVGWRYRLTGSLKIVSVETGKLLYQATATAEGADPVAVVSEVVRKCVYPLKGLRMAK